MSFGNPFDVARPRHAAVVQLLPVACLIVGKLGYNAGALSSKIASDRTLPASINPRASGIEHGTISTPPATRSCNPGAAPFDGTHGTAFGSIFRSLSNPANASCQMPPCPVPDAFSLPGFARMASSTSLTVLYDESARTWNPAGSAFTSASGVYEAGPSSVRPCQCIIVISTVIMPIV